LATDRLTVRFDGFDAHRTRTGETAFLSRLTAGYVSDFGVVVADARGVPGPPLYVCKSFSFNLNRICHTPRLSPDGRLIAFGAATGGGKLCKDSYGTAFGYYVMVRDRRGAPVASFEGYDYPDWLPDGRLLMLGTPCRGAGVWVADASLRAAPTRADANQVATPAQHPSASPDGGSVAFVWNGQLWALALGGRRELMQLTRLEKPVASAAWSPDGRALAVLQSYVSMPVKALVLLRPGDERSVVSRPLPFYPFGPISWH
jgi:Tol biopolymer transport system component